MQISDYLYAIRRRLWLPIVVPVIAALVTAGVLYIQPEHYQATATVIVPALSARGYSTSAVTQYFSTFKDVLVSTPVINQVAGQTGEKPSNLVAGLSANVVTASSNIIEVTYIGPNKTTVANVAEAGAQDSLDILMQPQFSAATNALTVAQQTLADADAQRSAYESTSGHPDPVDEFKFKSQALSAFEVQRQQAQLGHLTNHVAFLNQVIAQRQQALLELTPIVDQWRKLDQSVRAAEGAVDHAQIVVNNVNGEITSNHDLQTVTVKSDGHVSRLPTMLRFGGVAFGVALLLALGFIVAMEFFGPTVAKVPYLRRLATPGPRLEPAAEAVGNANGSGGYPAEVLASADAAPETASEMPPATGSVAEPVGSAVEVASAAGNTEVGAVGAIDGLGGYPAKDLPTADETSESAREIGTADSVAEPADSAVDPASAAADAEVVAIGAFDGSAGATENGSNSPKPGARKTRS